MINKRAAELSISTIVLIIIAVIVLIVVVWFFTTTTGKQIFPAIGQRLKEALGLWNATKLPSP